MSLVIPISHIFVRDELTYIISYYVIHVVRPHQVTILRSKGSNSPPKLREAGEVYILLTLYNI